MQKKLENISTLKKNQNNIPIFFFLKGPGRPDFRSWVDRGQSEIARIEFLSGWENSNTTRRAHQISGSITGCSGPGRSFRIQSPRTWGGKRKGKCFIDIQLEFDIRVRLIVEFLTLAIRISLSLSIKWMSFKEIAVFCQLT